VVRFSVRQHTQAKIIDIYVGWHTESFAGGMHSRGDSNWLPRHWRSQMNDEIEHQPGSRHRATQSACHHWAPIVPLQADGKDGSRESVVMPQPTGLPKVSAEKNPA